MTADQRGYGFAIFRERCLLSPLRLHDRILAGRLLGNLYEAFPWLETPQGSKYWSKVAENLRNLAGEHAHD